MSVSLSTHVLDTSTGKPAGGVRVELARQREVLASDTTDDDGRIRELAANLEPGRYELMFWPTTAFFHKVELEIELEDGH
jgi:5-hydroxyisourate hydrolase-like protein (transthyretin family)